MVDRQYFTLVAGLGLAAASLWPATAIHAHGPAHGNHREWSEKLARDIKAEVRHSMAKAAVGMEKGVEGMLRGADKMEAYADRLEAEIAAYRARRRAQ